MHKCLLIQEVLRTVFECLVTFEDDEFYFERSRGLSIFAPREESTLRTLAALARTCKAFTEPALDVLWREIPDLYVVMKYLMPTRILPEQAKWSKPLYVSGDPNDAEWERIDSYLIRVRIIGTSLPAGFEDRDRGMFLDYTLTKLEKHVASKGEKGVLLPKLTHVMWQTSWQHERFVRLLLVPTLRHVHLPAWHWSVHIYSSARNAQPFRTFRQDVFTALSRIHGLKNLCINYDFFTPELSHIFSSRSLVKLTVEDNRKWISARPPSPIPCLQELFFIVFKAESAPFLSGIHARKVNILVDIEHDDIPQSVNLRSTFTSILRSLSSPVSISTPLEHLKIEVNPRLKRFISYMAGAANNVRTLSISDGAKCLQDLPLLSSLQTVRIETDVVLQLDNDFLRTLAGGLPKLVTLSLVPPVAANFIFDRGGSDGVAPLPTLDGLLPLIEHCPRLSCIRIAVCAVFSADFVPAKVHPVSGSASIKELELWTTPVSELSQSSATEVMRTFFEAFFPAVRSCRICLPLMLSKELGTLSFEAKREACERWEAILASVFTTATWTRTWRVV